MPTAIIGVGNIGKRVATDLTEGGEAVMDEAIRIEVFGDLHDLGGLNGRLVTLAEARPLL
jgi:hypothetical protein